ncbi:MAG: YicC/YloC family endoribonuclease [Nitrospirota bacterium]
MIQSMTGYGVAERDGFKVEVKSLNHRYIDVSVRMPSALMEHEIPIRNLIKRTFTRGKIDVMISLTEQRRLKVRLNKQLAKDLYTSFRELQRDISIPGTLTIDFLSGYRELVLAEEAEYNNDALYEALRAAVSRVEEMRKQEGEALRKELLLHTERMEHLRTEVEQRAKEVVPRYKERLLQRIAELLSSAPVDETRLAQEAAIIAQKGDITEEVARLRSHIQQCTVLLSQEEAVGRKLDFLIQEMNREANTIASKVDDVAITALAIEMKTTIEKLREQIQNIQ